MNTNIDELKALNPKLGELFVLKYQGFEKEIGQVASNGNLHSAPIFDDNKNQIFVHFKPQSYPAVTGKWTAELPK